MVIGLTDRQWRGLVKVLGQEQEIAGLGERLALDLSQEGDRWAARHDISALFRPWFTARTLAEVAPLFDAAGLTWSVFRSFAQAVAEDPDLSPDNPIYQMLDQPGIGRLAVPGSPVSFGAFDRISPCPAPVLGQHSEEILSDVLGLGTGQIGRLMDLGVVAGP
jgi:2-methylfumaryl-CoA isomerase